MSDDPGFTMRPVEHPPVRTSRFAGIHQWLFDHPDQWLELEVDPDTFASLKAAMTVGGKAKGYEVRERRRKGETPRIYVRRTVKKKRGEL